MSNSSKAASYGRPRLLTHEEILDAAVELGLENVTMKKLSNVLGVGTATIYQYFESRKTLMRAAAVHSLAEVSLPTDEGQHWSILARGYIQGLMKLFTDNPSYFTSMNPTEFGFEVHFKLIEPFLMSMKTRGISPVLGMRLFNHVGIIAYGGAVEAIRQGEFEFQDETMDIVARRQFARLDPNEYPLMAQAMDEFTLDPEDKTESLIRSAFKSFAREIGEDEAQILKKA